MHLELPGIRLGQLRKASLSPARALASVASVIGNPSLRTNPSGGCNTSGAPDSSLNLRPSRCVNGRRTQQRLRRRTTALPALGLRLSTDGPIGHPNHGGSSPPRRCYTRQGGDPASDSYPNRTRFFSGLATTDAPHSTRSTFVTLNFPHTHLALQRASTHHEMQPTTHHEYASNTGGASN